MKFRAFTAALAIALACIGGRADAQVVNGATPSVGRFRTILKSTSSTACTNIEANPGYLVEIINTGPLLTVYLQLYDEGASPTCLQADLLYGDGTSATAIPAGQAITLTIPVQNGIAYKLTGPLPATQNIVITRI